MEIIYNKLIRDKIPEKISQDKGCSSVTRVLSEQEYKKALEDKLLEEYNEFISAKTNNERIAELVDLYQILIDLTKLEGLSVEELSIKADEKRLIRGGFSKRIFLEKTVEPDK
jgi:predicted house-cleaning noncanonical NTP pyrophosphatase (MazG superfamily)